MVADEIVQRTRAGVKAVATVGAVPGHGTAPQSLKEVARIGATIIVMGSNGMTGLEGILVGSSTQNVLHLGKVQAVVVHDFYV